MSTPSQSPHDYILAKPPATRQTWLLFGGIEAFFFVIIFFFYPETKGRTLEEIEAVLGSGAGDRVKAVVTGVQDPHVSEGEVRLRLKGQSEGQRSMGQAEETPA